MSGRKPKAANQEAPSVLDAIVPDASATVREMLGGEPATEPPSVPVEVPGVIRSFDMAAESSADWSALTIHAGPGEPLTLSPSEARSAYGSHAAILQSLSRATELKKPYVELKTSPKYFDAVAHDIKRAEIRRDDNEVKFYVGLRLYLREYTPGSGPMSGYSGRYCFREIIHILRSEDDGGAYLPAGMVMLSVKPTSALLYDDINLPPGQLPPDAYGESGVFPSWVIPKPDGDMLAELNRYGERREDDPVTQVKQHIAALGQWAIYTDNNTESTNDAEAKP